MTLADLIATARREADDTATPALWSNDEWREFANDAENEACRRARLITDATTSAICSVNITSGNPTFTLDPRVVFVRRVKLTSESQPLISVDHRDLDEQAPNWEDTTGIPRRWVRNWETGKVRLWPIPDDDDTASLRVVRLPLAPMVADVDHPEINPRFHRSLVFWMLYRAFSKTDSQTMNAKAAAENMALFEREFGQKSTAVDETWIVENHGEDSHEGLY